MASYKAEFLAHYYQGRLRPRQAYALGLIPVWARLAARAPGLANSLLSAPLTSHLAKLAAGVAGDRSAPEFPARTFRDWFAGHSGPDSGPEVVLWPDTFTNYFTPEVGIAATSVLESAGYRVLIPDRQICCGRPLFDYGMLPTARRWLGRAVDQLREPARAGVPIIGLEPSCLAAFRDELVNLYPEDEDARRLAGQSVTLAGFLAGAGYQPPRLDARALVQVHCHQGAVLGYDQERKLLEGMGLDLEVPDSGCCGMAGSFGYESGDRYRVSQDCGERVILPAVRAAEPSTLIIADGFSCREQIAQGSTRRPLHLAQVLQLAADGSAADDVGGAGQAGRARAEAGCWEPRPRSAAVLTAVAAGLALTAGAGALVYRRVARNSR